MNLYFVSHNGSSGGFMGGAGYVPISGGDPVNVVSGVYLPESIAVDNTDEKMYIVAQGQIYWCDLDGTNLEILVSGADLPAPNDSVIFGSARIDPFEEKIFITDTTHSRVLSCDKDGSNISTLAKDPDAVNRLSLDTDNRTVYYLGQSLSPNFSKVKYIDYDATTSGVFMDVSYSDIIDISLDEINQDMYWTDSSNKYIEFASISGGGPTTVVDYAPDLVISLLADDLNEHVYYGSTDGYVKRVDFDGGNDHYIASGLTGQLKEITDLALTASFEADNNCDLFLYCQDPSTTTVASGIYFTSLYEGTVNNVPQGSTESQIVVSGFTFPQELFVSESNDAIYFTSFRDVIKYDLNAGTSETLIDNIDTPAPNEFLNLHGITVDETNSKIYINDSYYGKVIRADLDGSNIEVLYSASGIDTGYGQYRSIALNPTTEQVYWLVQRSAGHPGPEEYSIHRMDYDGSNHETIVDDGMHRISLKIDDDNQTLYWILFPSGIVQSSGIGGGSVTNVLDKGGQGIEAMAIDIDNSQLYLSDYSNDTVFREDFGGGNIEILASGSEYDEVVDIFFVSSASGSPSEPVEEAESVVSDLRIINRMILTDDYQPEVTSTFTSQPSSVNIKVWDVTNGANERVAIVNSGCYLIGGTNTAGWSTANLLLTLEQSKYHYYYEMISDNNESQYGEFLINVPESIVWDDPG